MQLMYEPLWHFLSLFFSIIDWEHYYFDTTVNKKEDVRLANTIESFADGTPILLIAKNYHPYII